MAKRKTPTDASPKSSTATIGFESRAAESGSLQELEAQFAESAKQEQAIRACHVLILSCHFFVLLLFRLYSL